MNTRSKQKIEIGYTLIKLYLDNHLYCNLNTRYAVAKINILKNKLNLEGCKDDEINNRLFMVKNAFIIEITSLDNKKNYRKGYSYFSNNLVEIDKYYTQDDLIYFSTYENLINYFMNIYINDFQIIISNKKIQLFNPFNKIVKVYKEYCKENKKENELDMILYYDKKGFLKRINYITSFSQYDSNYSEIININVDKSKKYYIYSYGELFAEFSEKDFINSWTF